MSGEGTVVCVTGGSGYIASWPVKLLLHRGYTVKATVRDPAEDAAWKFAEESGISLVTMHPGWTIGPLLQPTLNITVEMLLNHIKELETFPGNIDKFVDVRDVSNARIQAFEKASASGRYCLVGKLGHISEIVKIVHEHYPTLHLPESKPFMPEYEVSKEKAKALGMDFTPSETTVKDIIESLKEKCYLLV